LEGDLFLVAIKGAVARVPVLEWLAVFVCNAIAIDRETGAFSLPTLVSHGARITVVTRGLVGLGGAASQRVAKIVGARVVVIANDGQADTRALFAVVADGAGVTVDALPFVEHQVLASFGALA